MIIKPVLTLSSTGNVRRKQHATLAMPRDCVTWTNNCLAFVSQKGVEIIETHPDFKTIKLKNGVSVIRSCIKPPKRLLRPRQQDVRQVVKRLKVTRRINDPEFWQLFAYRNIHSRCHKIKLSLHSKKNVNFFVKQIGWAPEHPNYSTKPLLAILNNWGNLSFYAKTGVEWTDCADISSLWHDRFLKSELVNKENKLDPFSILDYDEARIQAFAWCGNLDFDTGSKFLFVCGVGSTALIFWTVSPKMEGISYFQMTRISDCGSKFHRLHWHKLTGKSGILIACFFNGVVRLYLVSFVREFKVELSDELHVGDGRLPYHVRTHRFSKYTTVVFSKMNFLYVFRLREADLKITGKCSKDFQGGEITGLEILNRREVLIVLDDNTAHRARYDDDTLNTANQRVDRNSIEDAMSVFGARLSPNKAFCAFVYRITKVRFHHLESKSPTKIAICPLMMKPEGIENRLLAFNRFDSVPEMNDLLQCARILSTNWAKKKRFTAERLKNFLPKLLGKNVENLRQLRLKFQIAYLLHKILSFKRYFFKNRKHRMLRLRRKFRMKNDLNMDEEAVPHFNAISDVIVKESATLKTVVMVCNAILWWRKRKSGEVTDSCEDMRKRCVIKQWLVANLNKIPASWDRRGMLDAAREILAEVQDAWEERCVVCFAAVTSEGDANFVECENGHKIRRCHLSLLPVGDRLHFVCCVCNCVTLADANNESECMPRCGMCDSNLYWNSDFHVNPKENIDRKYAEKLRAKRDSIKKDALLDRVRNAYNSKRQELWEQRRVNHSKHKGEIASMWAKERELRAKIKAAAEGKGGKVAGSVSAEMKRLHAKRTSLKNKIRTVIPKRHLSRKEVMPVIEKIMRDRKMNNDDGGRKGVKRETKGLWLKISKEKYDGEMDKDECKTRKEEKKRYEVKKRAGVSAQKGIRAMEADYKINYLKRLRHLKDEMNRNESAKRKRL